MIFHKIKISLFNFFLSFVFLFSYSIAIEEKIEGILCFKEDKSSFEQCSKELREDGCPRCLNFEIFQIDNDASKNIFKSPLVLGFHNFIEVTQDGLYSLTCHYSWKNNDFGQGGNGPITGIAIKKPGDFGAFFKRSSGNFDDGYINRVTKLKKYDKVFVHVRGTDNSYYKLSDWILSVEKLS